MRPNLIDFIKLVGNYLAIVWQFWQLFELIGKREKMITMYFHLSSNPLGKYDHSAI